MENLLFFAIIFGMMTNFTVGAITFSGVNRTFASMYKGVIETSISTIGEGGQAHIPYFDKTLLEKNVSKYLEDNLTRYVTHYQASIYYFDPKNGAICPYPDCYAVRITLKADINYFFKYEKAKNFYITSTNTL